MTSDRRGFLKKLGGFVVFFAGASCLFRYLSPARTGGEILLKEKISKIPEGGALIYADRQTALLKLGGKVSAVSLTCTHLGCTIGLDGDRFACPCHGSVFGLDGRVIKGPAVKKLNFYVTEEQGDSVTVYRRYRA